MDPFISVLAASGAVPVHTPATAPGIPSYRDKLNYRLHITPLDGPLLIWDNKKKEASDGTSRPRRPRDYLTQMDLPFGSEAAEWQFRFFANASGGGGKYGVLDVNANDLRNPNVSGLLQYRSQPEVHPLRPDAPTMVLLFYPRPDQDEARPIHKSESYLRRIQRIAAMGEQTIIYVPPELADDIKAMRPDPHWYVISKWATVWDLPNNDYQRDNFGSVQPDIFARFAGYVASDGELQPQPRYNRPHHSAVCNAKAFVMYDAVLRNPFGCDRWMYVDAGFLFDDGPLGGGDGSIGVEHFNGVDMVTPRFRPWGDLIDSGLDSGKFDRAITISQDTGVVMGEYPHWDGCPTADDVCWTNPTRSWRTRQFIAQIYVGSSIGMLEYSTRFMQTVDDMDAAGMYTGREELVVGFVALRYPNTIYSVPWTPLPRRLDYPWQFPMKFVFSRYGGPESVPAIRDPIAALYCYGQAYIPRQPDLHDGGIYKMTAALWTIRLARRATSITWNDLKKKHVFKKKNKKPKE